MMGLLRRLSSVFTRTRNDTRSSFVRRTSRRTEQKGNVALEKLLNKANTVLNFIQGEGSITLEQLSTEEPESLTDILNVQRRFERFYILSKKYLDHGAEANGQLDEHIQQHGDDTEVTDKIEDLDMQLYLFRKRIDERRQLIQDAIPIYKELDKVYDWAVRGAKIVSRMDVKENGTLIKDECQDHRHHIEEFLANNPPFSEDHFRALIRKASELEQPDILEICERIRLKCQSTHTEITRQISVIDKLPESRRELISSNDSECSHVDVINEEGAKPALENKDHEHTSPQVEASKKEGRVEGKTFAKGKEVRDRKDIRNRLGVNTQDEQRDSLHSDYSIDSGISVNSRGPRQGNSDEGSIPVATGEPDTYSPDTSGEGDSTLIEEDENDKTLTESFVRRKTRLEGVEDRDEETRSTDLSWIVATVNSLDGDQSDQDSSYDSSPKGPPESNRHIHDDLPSSPSEILKHEKKMLFLVDEMIHTEEDYVSFLEYTIDSYFPEMVREDIPNGLRGLRSVVFGNLEKIYDFHKQHFLPSLKKYRAKPSKVGACFLKYKEEFGLYSLYSKNKPKSDALLAEFRDFFNLKREALSDRFDLASYLLKPIQRLGKYALLLQDIIRACGETDQDHASLKDSVDMIHFQMRHGNDLLALDHLKGVDFNIREQGELLRQRAFTVYRGYRKAVRHVFFFEEMLVFTKPVKVLKGPEEYRYKFSLKMNDIGLTENIGHSGLRFRVWFRKVRTGISYTLHAPSIQVKQEWTSTISRILWSQAMRSKASQTAELRSMGLESKPSLDLKPSADMIQNRSVDVQLNKNRRPQSTFITTSPADEKSVGNTRKDSWLGSPPPTITEIAEEEGNQDFRHRINSELDVTSLPELTVCGLTLEDSMDTFGAMDSTA